MKWLPKPAPAIPEHGAKATVVYFAWFPERLSDDSVIWLEKYKMDYEFFRWKYGKWAWVSMRAYQ